MNESIATGDSRIELRFATADDAGLILDFIRQLADYEKLSPEVVADEGLLRQTLFGDRQVAEVVIASCDKEPAGFALFFHNFSTFLGRPGIYLEDLFVIPKLRGRGIGRVLLSYLAQIAVGTGRAESAFAGESAQFRLHLDNRARHDRPSILVRHLASGSNQDGITR